EPGVEPVGVIPLVPAIREFDKEDDAAGTLEGNRKGKGGIPAPDEGVFPRGGPFSRLRLQQDLPHHAAALFGAVVESKLGFESLLSVKIESDPRGAMHSQAPERDFFARAEATAEDAAVDAERPF